MVRICITIFLVAWTSQVLAQGWIEPAVNCGTSRINWQEAVELKTSRPSWEVVFGTRLDRGVLFGSFRGTHRSRGETENPITVSGQTLGKKNIQTKGQAQAGTGSQETVLVDASVSRLALAGTWAFRDVFRPVLRCEYINLSITASGKIDGKQVEATEACTRFYPQIGLAYVHREGPAFVTLLGTVGQRSSHLEANLNWNIRPDAWVGVGGKRSYFGCEQGRAESAVFTVKAGWVF